MFQLAACMNSAPYDKCQSGYWQSGCIADKYVSTMQLADKVKKHNYYCTFQLNIYLSIIYNMEIILNEHNKVEYPPMHTVEHILNQTMVRMFGCERSKNSHIEKRKSKCDYKISIAPTSEQIEAIEATVNEIINQHLSVTSFFVTRDNVPSDVDLSKLPDDASETLRIVKIGDYDICACIGAHVNNTSEIGKFTIISTDYTEGRFRIRFKLANS